MKRNILLAILIGGVFAVLMIVFTLGLKNNPNDLDLATKGQKIPKFSLPTLLSKQTMTNADLTTDKPYFLLNFWGSWCPACYKEHPYLMQMSKTQPLYGVNWKDDHEAGRNFIRQGGNPFKSIIIDDNSLLAIGLGVYGAPETFLIAADGTIIHRYAGSINAAIWQSEFVPKIKQLEQ